MIVKDGWHLPFDDFFSHLPDNISIDQFGINTRIEALNFCSNRSCAIDIGSHIGISVAHWAKEFDKVYAFEPVQQHFTCLIENLKKFNNVETFNYAVGNFTGNSKGSYRTKKNSGSFQLIDEGYVQPKHKDKIRNLENINVIKLDSFNFSKVDLIKIDVEGWEAEVLEGAVNTIKTHKPVLMIEVLVDNPHKTLKTNYNLEKFNDMIKHLNYREIKHIKPDDKIFISYE